jgi:hypothetical protein
MEAMVSPVVLRRAKFGGEAEFPLAIKPARLPNS